MRKGLEKKFIKHVSISSQDANVIEKHIQVKNPQNILEVGTFIGVSSTVLGLAKEESAQLTCVDLNFPVAAHNLVGSGGFIVKDETPTLEYVSSALDFFECKNGVNLVEGFFSTPLPENIMEKIQASKWQRDIPIVGKMIGNYGPFDMVFLDGDHSERGVYNDLKLAINHIAKDAHILLHDVTDSWQDGVRGGIEKFCIEYPHYELVSIESNVGTLKNTAV